MIEASAPNAAAVFPLMRGNEAMNGPTTGIASSHCHSRPTARPGGKTSAALACQATLTAVDRCSCPGRGCSDRRSLLTSCLLHLPVSCRICLSLVLPHLVVRLCRRCLSHSWPSQAPSHLPVTSVCHKLCHSCVSHLSVRFCRTDGRHKLCRSCLSHLSEAAYCNMRQLIAE